MRELLMCVCICVVGLLRQSTRSARPSPDPATHPKNPPDASAGMDDAALSAEIEARYAAYDEYYPPATFDAMVCAYADRMIGFLSNSTHVSIGLPCPPDPRLHACPPLPPTRPTLYHQPNRWRR